MTNFENAIIWLYVKTWGKFGDHVIKEKDLWHFSASDLEVVIMGLAFPRTKEKNERVKALTDLIMDRFEQDGTAFYEWVAKIHKEVIEALPETVEQQQPVVKIEWDPSKCLGLFNRYLWIGFKIVNLYFSNDIPCICDV